MHLRILVLSLLSIFTTLLRTALASPMADLNSLATSPPTTPDIAPITKLLATNPNITDSIRTAIAQAILNALIISHRKPSVKCGELSIVEGGFIVPMYTSNLCTSADEFEHFKYVDNWTCGICIIFMSNNCQRDIKYWGGPDTVSHDVEGAQAYWCM